MTIKEITDLIEAFAPLALQESYDNSGLIVGRPDDQVHKALLAVDVTDEVMDEAESEGCDIIITHHPIIFHPLKRFNSANQVERCVERAIRRGIALYACHTNLDSTAEGMSWRLATMLGVKTLEVLQPTAAGEQSGFGVVGEIEEPMPTEEFMHHLMEVTGAEVVRHSDIATPTVSRVAVCTGSGAFLIGEARKAGADIYVTADLKYNDFMAPDGALTVADIGHLRANIAQLKFYLIFYQKIFLPLRFARVSALAIR